MLEVQVSPISTSPFLARVKQSISQVTTFLKSHGLTVAAGLLLLPIAGLEIVHSLDVLLVPPAHAAFFTAAQNWMVTALAGATGSSNTAQVLGIIFNVLRGLFLLYVAYALVQVIKSARDGEDWQATARTPLIVIMSMAVGDLITATLTNGA
jgi:uncharacterized membrane protein required for colicin V production